jgi:hypothetical protein
MSSPRLAGMAMTEGRYLYCIADIADQKEMATAGLRGSKVYSRCFNDISAVISSVPFREMNTNVNDIMTHQQVVEEVRKLATVLPIRFGVILRNDENVAKLLSSSYQEYRSKLAKFKGKEEFGIKVVLGNDGRRAVENMAIEQSDEIKKLREQIAATDGKGSVYFLRMKLDDAKKNQTYRILEKIITDVKSNLMSASEDQTILKSDLVQIIFNASYLVRTENSEKFKSIVSALQKSYNSSYTVDIHLSGPWAPYSFC